MHKPKPIRTRSPSATHADEMARRKVERSMRVTDGNHRTRTIIQIIDGAVVPTRRYTMWNGIRIRANGTPRSRSYKAAYALPLNAAGEPRR